MGPRRQHLRRRRREPGGRQRPHREVRQGRPLHQVLGIARQRPRPVQRLHGIASTRRATSTSRTPATTHPGVRRRRQREVADHQRRRRRQRSASRPGRISTSYSSNSNDPETLDNGEIYKLELDGRIVGKFGRAGKLPKEFGMVNSIDCRSRERAAGRRADQLARAEGDAAPEISHERIARSSAGEREASAERLHSNRSATMGSTLVARRAGT